MVIPCRNGAHTIGRQLDALLGQSTGAEFEVIVADNGSTDDTAALILGALVLVAVGFIAASPGPAVLTAAALATAVWLAGGVSARR